MTGAPDKQRSDDGPVPTHSSDGNSNQALPIAGLPLSTDGESRKDSDAAARTVRDTRPETRISEEFEGDQPMAEMEGRERLARQLQQRIKAAKSAIGSRFDDEASKTILNDAIMSSDRSASIVHAALQFDMERHNKLERLKYVWRPSHYDPGNPMRQKQKVDRIDKYRKKARDQAISTAIDSVKDTRNIDKATMTLARAIASDESLKSAFKDHEGFRTLVKSVAINNPELERFAEEVRSNTDRDYTVADPQMVCKDLMQRREHETGAGSKILRRVDTTYGSNNARPSRDSSGLGTSYDPKRPVRTLIRRIPDTRVEQNGNPREFSHRRRGMVR